MKYNPYLKAQWGTETPDEGRFPQYQYYPYLYDNTDVGSFPRTVPWSNPIDNRMEMTDANYMQMYDESLIKNYDRMYPDKSNIQDYMTSPQIQPRESNQQTLLRDRIKPIKNFSIETVRDVTSPGGTMPIQQPLETPYLDALMNQGNVPVDYLPFASEDEMNKFYNPITQEPEVNNETSSTNNIAPELINIPFKKSDIYSNIDNTAKNMPLPGLDEEASKRQSISNIIDINSYNLPNIVKKPEYNFGQKDITEEQTQTPKNKFGTPESYFLGKSLLDATALMNNMVQPQPPSLQMKIPHYERMRLDPTQYDAARSDIRGQGTQAYRMSRENMSQASDLMKGLSAITSGTQQNLMNVGVQQAAAQDQINKTNQEISAQEQSQQTQILNQETATNYQIQAQAQQFKDQMISQQLSNLTGTAGAYAKYAAIKEYVNKQDEFTKKQAQFNNELQANLLEYEISNKALESDEYGDYLKSEKKKEQERIKSELLGSEKYQTLNQYYNGVMPDYSTYVMNEDSPQTKEKLRTIFNAKQHVQKYPDLKEPEKGTLSDEEYKDAINRYNESKQIYDYYESEPAFKMYESEQQYWKDWLSQYNETKFANKAAESYLKTKGLPTTIETLQKLKALSERSQQMIQ